MKRIILVAVLALMAMAGTAMAVDTQTVAVSASVVGTCKFSTGGTVAFGNLDPAAGGDVTGIVTQPTFWCTKGSGYTITDDNGVNESGTTFRMQQGASGNYIPYTFTYTATGTGTGKTSTLTMNIAASVLGTDYVNAQVGAYSDTVTLTINP